MSGKPIFYHVSSLTSLFNVNYSDRGREKQVRRLQNHSTGTPNRYSWSKSNSRHHYTSWKTREKKKKKEKTLDRCPKHDVCLFEGKAQWYVVDGEIFFLKIIEEEKRCRRRSLEINILSNRSNVSSTILYFFLLNWL